MEAADRCTDGGIEIVRAAQRQFLADLLEQLWVAGLFNLGFFRARLGHAEISSGAADSSASVGRRCGKLLKNRPENAPLARTIARKRRIPPRASEAAASSIRSRPRSWRPRSHESRSARA